MINDELLIIQILQQRMLDGKSETAKEDWTRDAGRNFDFCF